MPKRKYYGQLSSEDIKKESCKKDGLRIYEGTMRCIKGASYDITPTVIAMSARRGMLETVYREKKYPFRYFINVKAKDTVLLISNEYLRVPSYIAGHVVSRVSRVTEGFGHISTSIDPNWHGALLIALSNPMNKPLKVYVGQNALGLNFQNPLATVTFHYINTALKQSKGEYPGMRVDLLKREHYRNRFGLRQWLFKTIHFNRRAFTDFFFELCEANGEGISEENWPKFVQQINGSSLKHEAPIKGRTCILDFVITETWYVRVCLWFAKYRITLFAILLCLLSLFGILTNETRKEIIKFLPFF